jgi:hypothetical protein
MFILARVVNENDKDLRWEVNLQDDKSGNWYVLIYRHSTRSKYYRHSTKLYRCTNWYSPRNRDVIWSLMDVPFNMHTDSALIEQAIREYEYQVKQKYKSPLEVQRREVERALKSKVHKKAKQLKIKVRPSYWKEKYGLDAPPVIEEKKKAPPHRVTLLRQGREAFLRGDMEEAIRLQKLAESS